MPDPKDPAVQAALREAADECGLADYYRTCVYPLLRNPECRWPRCCGGGCEPCAQTLIDVAVLTLRRLGTPRQAPVD
jgi:hypothetical protein